MVRDHSFLTGPPASWSGGDGRPRRHAASGGWADLAGVRGDDLIVAFDRQPVTDAEAFLRAAAAPCELAACTRELLVERSGQTQILCVETIPEGGVPCGD